MQLTLEEIQVLLNLLIKEESHEVYKSNINKAIQLEIIRNKLKILINHNNINGRIIDAEYRDVDGDINKTEEKEDDKKEI